MCEIKSRTPRLQKVVVFEGDKGIDKADIGNLEDLLRVVLINESCGNLKGVIDGGQLTRNINQKKKTFYKPIDDRSVEKCCRREKFC